LGPRSAPFEQLGHGTPPVAIRAGCGALLGPLAFTELLLDHLQLLSRERVMHAVLHFDGGVNPDDRATARGAERRLRARLMGEGVSCVHTGVSSTPSRLTAVLPLLGHP